MRFGAIALFALLAAGAGCKSPQQSPYLRVTSEDGRVYYADTDRAIHSPTGGFLAFRDLVTRESVRLKNGSYTAQMCPPDEVKIRQVEYLNDPSNKPKASDYE